MSKKRYTGPQRLSAEHVARLERERREREESAATRRVELLGGAAHDAEKVWDERGCRTQEQRAAWARRQDRRVKGIIAAVVMAPFLLAVLVGMLIVHHLPPSLPTPVPYQSPLVYRTQCADGTWSTSTGSGTCSWHGGEAP